MYDQRQPGTFDIGRVLQRTFGAIGRNFPLFFGLSLVLAGGPSLVAQFAEEADDLGVRVLVGLVGWLISVLTTLVLQAGLVHGTVADLNGRRTTLSASLAVGGRTFLPVLGISILLVLGVFVGYALLVVPGVFLMVIWIVVVPAEVIERRGVFASFGRSRDLTRGHRWRVLGLLLIYFVLWVVIATVSTAIQAGIDGPEGQGLAGLVVFPLLTALSAMVAAVGAAATYVELRQAKEGVGAEDLAAVFA